MLAMNYRLSSPSPSPSSYIVDIFRHTQPRQLNHTMFLPYSTHQALPSSDQCMFYHFVILVKVVLTIIENSYSMI